MFLSDIPGLLSYPVMIDLAVKKKKSGEVMVSTSQLTHIILQWGTVPNLRAGSVLQRILGSGVK